MCASLSRIPLSSGSRTFSRTAFANISSNRLSSHRYIGAFGQSRVNKRLSFVLLSPPVSSVPTSSRWSQQHMEGPCSRRGAPAQRARRRAFGRRGPALCLSSDAMDREQLNRAMVMSDAREGRSPRTTGRCAKSLQRNAGRVPPRSTHGVSARLLAPTPRPGT